MQKTQVQSIGREDPLQKEMATHSSILAWKIPWTEEPDRPQSMGVTESDTTEQLSRHKQEAKDHRERSVWEKDGKMLIM